MHNFLKGLILWLLPLVSLASPVLQVQVTQCHSLGTISCNVSIPQIPAKNYVLTQPGDANLELEVSNTKGTLTGVTGNFSVGEQLSNGTTTFGQVIAWNGTSVLTFGLIGLTPSWPTNGQIITGLTSGASGTLSSQSQTFDGAALQLGWVKIEPNEGNIITSGALGATLQTLHLLGKNAEFHISMGTFNNTTPTWLQTATAWTVKMTNFGAGYTIACPTVSFTAAPTGYVTMQGTPICNLTSGQVQDIQITTPGQYPDGTIVTATFNNSGTGFTTSAAASVTQGFGSNFGSSCTNASQQAAGGYSYAGVAGSIFPRYAGQTASSSDMQPYPADCVTIAKINAFNQRLYNALALSFSSHTVYEIESFLVPETTLAPRCGANAGSPTGYYYYGGKVTDPTPDNYPTPYSDTAYQNAIESIVQNIYAVWQPNGFSRPKTVFSAPAGSPAVICVTNSTFYTTTIAALQSNNITTFGADLNTWGSQRLYNASTVSPLVPQFMQFLWSSTLIPHCTPSTCQRLNGLSPYNLKLSYCSGLAENYGTTLFETYAADAISSNAVLQSYEQIPHTPSLCNH